MERVINKLTQFLCLHINQQFKNGADIVQIFDSWAGIISKKILTGFVLNQTRKLFNFVEKNKSPQYAFQKE